MSLNKEATAIVPSLPSGLAGLDDKYSNSVTKLFQSAVAANFTAVRLFLHGEDEASQLQTQPGQLETCDACALSLLACFLSHTRRFPLQRWASNSRIAVAWAPMHQAWSCTCSYYASVLIVHQA